MDEWRADLPTVAELWPPGARVASRRPVRSSALLMLPSRRAPRLLLPSDVPGAGDLLLRHTTSRAGRLRQRALSWGLRAGLLPLLPFWRLLPAPSGAPGETVEDYVRQQVAGAARVAVLLGPPRANAKPVLRVFDAQGRTVAFGKVGHDPFSARLVRRESDVLTELASRPLRHLIAPTVINRGSWRSLEILLMTPLPAPTPRPVSWKPAAEAMYELAELDGIHCSRVGESTYLADLARRVGDLPSTNGPALTKALATVVAQTGDRVLGFGRWHGDWAPWNVALAGDRACVWDWERSRPDVPLGFDAVHLAAQEQLQRHRSAPADVSRVLVDVSAETLSRWYDSRDDVKATVMLYLVEILQRYRADAKGTPTPRLRSRLATVETTLSSIVTNGPRRLRADA